MDGYASAGSGAKLEKETEVMSIDSRIRSISASLQKTGQVLDETTGRLFGAIPKAEQVGKPQEVRSGTLGGCHTSLDALDATARWLENVAERISQA